MTTLEDAHFCLEVCNMGLVGGKIVGTISDEKGSWGLMVERDNKKVMAWVDCDPEGNGPGFINIEKHSCSKGD